MIRAKEIAKTGKISHIRPNGKRGISLIDPQKARGENIGIGYQTCREVSAAWYASPTHKKNMLRRDFKKIGIAAYSINGSICWVQMFSS